MEDWIYGVWFVGDGRSKDWMAKLVRVGDKWTLRYRFRYYDAADPGNDPHSDADQKNWYAFEANDDSTQARDLFVDRLNSTVVPIIEARFGSKADFVLLDCSPSDPKMLFELGSRDWCHVKRETEVKQ